jgi:hypothetical protein
MGSNAFVNAIRDKTIEDLIDELGNVAGHVVLVFPHNRPPGFPRGVFLSETHKGTVCRYDPLKVLEWVRREENKQT